MGNWSVLLLLATLEGLNDLSTAQPREKSSKSKSAVTFPKVVKLPNEGVGCADLVGQRMASYQLDCKSSVRFFFGSSSTWWILRMSKALSFITWKSPTTWLFQTSKRTLSQSILFNGIRVDKDLFHHHNQIKGRSSPALPTAMVAIYLNFNRPGRDVFIFSVMERKTEHT